jgi:hypothetical protein
LRRSLFKPNLLAVGRCGARDPICGKGRSVSIGCNQSNCSICTCTCCSLCTTKNPQKNLNSTGTELSLPAKESTCSTQSASRSSRPTPAAEKGERLGGSRSSWTLIINVDLEQVRCFHWRKWWAISARAVVSKV